MLNLLVLDEITDVQLDKGCFVLNSLLSKFQVGKSFRHDRDLGLLVHEKVVHI